MSKNRQRKLFYYVIMYSLHFGMPRLSRLRVLNGDFSGAIHFVVYKNSINKSIGFVEFSMFFVAFKNDF